MSEDYIKFDEIPPFRVNTGQKETPTLDGDVGDV
jgi:hypothetical protein